MIERLRALCQEDERLEAAMLYGSFARQEADQFSDIDAMLVITSYSIHYTKLYDGIPIGNSGDAVLLDWDMAGWGLAEMDLAYMFLGPYANHRRLDRQKALNYYWRQRQAVAGVYVAAGPGQHHRPVGDGAVQVRPGWLPPFRQRNNFV